jgi:hypothetical protein
MLRRYQLGYFVGSLSADDHPLKATAWRNAITHPNRDGPARAVAAQREARAATSTVNHDANTPENERRR